MSRRFSGSTDRILVTAQSNTDLSGVMTVAFWVKWNTINTWRYLTHRGNIQGSAPYDYWEILFRSDAKLYFAIGTTGGGWTQIASTSDMAAGSWVHVAATWDGSTMRLYINGTQENSASVSGTMPSTDTNLYIGNNSSNNGVTDGWMAEYAYWSSALTASEIAALAKGASPLAVRPGPKLYLPLYGVASPEPNLAGSGYTGTVTGATSGDHAPVGPPVPLVLGEQYQQTLGTVHELGMSTGATASLSSSLRRTRGVALGASASSALTAKLGRKRPVVAPFQAAAMPTFKLPGTIHLEAAWSGASSTQAKLSVIYRLRLPAQAIATPTVRLGKRRILALGVGVSGRFAFLNLAVGNIRPFYDGFFSITPSVWIANSSGTMVDRTAWFDEFSMGESVDDNGPYITLKVKRDQLNPLLNPTNIDLVRRVQVQVKITSLVTGIEETFELFQGYIDRIGFAHDPVTVSCRGLYALLQDRFIEVEREYGSDSGVAIQSVMQSILNDNGFSSITLYVPVNPGVMLKRYRQARVPVLAALRALATQIGWDVRYQYVSGQWRLTLVQPQRTKTTPDHYLKAQHYLDISNLEKRVDDIRNRIAVVFGPADNRTRVTVDDTTSQSKYGVRFMEIAEASTSNIDTSSEATNMAMMALSDLADAEYYQITLPFAPHIKAGDLLELEANNVHMTSNRKFGVYSIQHDLSNQGARTIIEGRADGVVGMVDVWLRKEESRSTDDIERGGGGAIQGSTPPTLPAPTGLAAQTGVDVANQSTFAWATLTWDAMPMNLLSRYEVAVRKVGDTYWTPYIARDNYIRLTTVPGGSTVEARVRAVAADLRGTTSAWSDTIQFTTASDTQAPYYGTTVPTPTGRTVKAGIEVQWPDVASSYPDYVKTEIQVRHSSESYHATALSAVAYGTKVEISRYVNASGTNVLMTPGFTYYARVRHVDATGNASAWSSETSAVCGQIEGADVNPNAPAQPSGFALASTQVIQDSQGQHSVNANFTWNSLSDSLLAGFALYYRLNGQTNWTLGTTVLASATEGRIEGLATGATYDFGIRSVSRFGAMSAITVISAQAMPSDSTPPAAPTGIGSNSVPGGVRVWWAAPTEKDYRRTRVRFFQGANFLFSDYTTANTMIHPNLTVGTTYSMYIAHEDWSGNLSSEVGVTETAGYVTTGLIASGAVSQYEALQVSDTNGVSTTSQSYVDIPGFSVSFTLYESCLVTVLMSVDSSNNITGGGKNASSYIINIDGDDVAGSESSYYKVESSSTQVDVVQATHWFAVLGAGSHTIKGRFRVGDNNVATFARSRRLSVLILKR